MSPEQREELTALLERMDNSMDSLEKTCDRVFSPENVEAAREIIAAQHGQRRTMTNIPLSYGYLAVIAGTIATFAHEKILYDIALHKHVGLMDKGVLAAGAILFIYALAEIYQKIRPPLPHSQ